MKIPDESHEILVKKYQIQQNTTQPHIVQLLIDTHYLNPVNTFHFLIGLIHHHLEDSWSLKDPV